MRDLVNNLIESGIMQIVRREVDPRFELAAVTQALQRRSNRPILFQNVKGSALPVVTNLYGSRRRVCELIGADGMQFCRRYQDVLKAGEPMRGKHLRAVATEDMVWGKLSDLPVPTNSEKDAGPYLTAAIFLAKDPETGTCNLSFHRAQVISDNEMRVNLGETHDLARYQATAEARGEPLEVAVLIGTSPEVFLAAAASLPIDDDELAAAACLAGCAIDMRPCRHISLDVPSSAEIVIEGRILPNVRRPEGPYGEFMGYYADRADRHVFQVDGVSWRNQALFHSILGASPEEIETLQLALATKIYRHLTNVMPGIIDVSCIGALAHTVVQIRQQYEGHARQAALMAFGADPRWTKVCTVVDEDVDIHDLADIAWASTVRVAPDSDVMVIPGVPSLRRDPGRKHWGRLAVMATVPFGREHEFERKRIPGADAIRLRDYGVSE